MPREIPRSRRYVTVQLPRDRDLIFRIGHILGRALSCHPSNIIYYLNSFTAPSKNLPRVSYSFFQNLDGILILTRFLVNFLLGPNIHSSKRINMISLASFIFIRSILMTE